MRNGRVARDLALLQGARRENILYGSSTDEQRSSSAKDRQPGGLFSGGHLAALLLSHRALWLCSFVAPCQLSARKQRAHSSFCYRLLVFHRHDQIFHDIIFTFRRVLAHVEGQDAAGFGFLRVFHFAYAHFFSDELLELAR